MTDFEVRYKVAFDINNIEMRVLIESSYLSSFVSNKIAIKRKVISTQIISSLDYIKLEHRRCSFVITIPFLI
jgi:hypothetical protein